MPFVQTNPIQMADNIADAFVIREKVGGINYVEIDTINGVEVIRLLPTGVGDMRCFVNSAEGITRYLGISGYKTSGSLAEARLGVGVHTDQVLSIYNAQGYYFDTHVSIGKANIENWQAAFTALQIGGTGSIVSDTAEGTNRSLIISQNAYYDGVWKAIVTDESSNYFQSAGEHVFRVSNGSDTADTAIAWVTALTIDNTGKVGIGVTLPLAAIHTLGTAIFDVTDNTGGVWKVVEGAREYIYVSTLDGSEAIDFGGPSDAVEYNFRGDGHVSIQGGLKTTNKVLAGDGFIDDTTARAAEDSLLGHFHVFVTPSGSSNDYFAFGDKANGHTILVTNNGSVNALIDQDETVGMDLCAGRTAVCRWDQGTDSWYYA